MQLFLSLMRSKPTRCLVLCTAMMGGSLISAEEMISDAPPAGPTTEANGALSNSAVHGQIMELLKQDVAKIPAKPKEAVAPFLNSTAVADAQPVAEGVLELEPMVVTKKKPLELPLRVKPVTLDNFFYGDGAIFKSADSPFVISVGPERNGLAAIKFTLKF